jgi:hypothetical protein
MVLRVFKKWGHYSVLPDKTSNIITFSAPVSFLCSSFRFLLLILHVEAHIQMNILKNLACCKEDLK